MSCEGLSFFCSFFDSEDAQPAAPPQCWPEEWPPHLVTTRELEVEELRRAVSRSLNFELSHTVAKRVRMKMQDPRRAIWTINHSTSML
jgi:hypothetical protein